MKLKHKFEFMTMEDEVVAIAVGESASQFPGIIKLNESAAKIFALLQEENTIEGIIEELKKEYEISKEELETFVKDYLQKLKEDGLLEE